MRRFWRIVVVAIASHTALAFAQDPSSAVAQGFSPVAVSRDELWKRCKNPDEDIRIAGCTALIQSAAETPSDEALARHNRATAYRNKREYELALQDLDQAIRLEPTFVDAVGDRGITLTALGRFADAIPDFTRVIGLEPKSAYALYDRGLAYELMGLDDLALEDFSAAIALEPRDAHRFERRGTVYFRTHDLDKALADYEKALEFDPQYAPALYGRGVVNAIKGDLAASGADLAQAQHFQPDVADVMRRAGVREK